MARVTGGPGTIAGVTAIVPALPAADAVLPWQANVDDAVVEIARARAAHGDTFTLAHDRYLFTFSPIGVRSFYALREEEASKGVADYLMLRRKLPDRIFEGRRTLPGTLFRKDDVADYLTNLDAALDDTVEELGESGTADVFALTRRLGHRMGLASWAGPEAARGPGFEGLVTAFDSLDGADAFVHPDAMAAVAASGKAAEEEALGEIEDLLGRVPPTDGLPARIHAAWSDVEDDATRRRGIALDVALVHVASMSNLHAALGWAIVDLLEHAEAVDRVRAGDAAFVSRCALESTRLAQRSLMARHVLSPVRLDVGDATYEVPAGWTIATLLPLLNTTAEPGLADWRPDRWERHRIVEPALTHPLSVTAFGHGRHSCPAQPFSLDAMSLALSRLVTAFDLAPAWEHHPRPVAAQIGGVARAAGPVVVEYARRG